MSGDALHHHRSGQRGIPIRAYNAFVDAAVAHRGSLIGGGAGRPSFSTSQTIIKIKNETGDDVPRYAVLQPSNPVFSADIEDVLANPIVFQATLPGEPTLATAVPFVVTLEPIPDGEYGRAVISGVTFARISPGAIAGRYAHPTQDETHLVGDNWGNAYLLWAESGAEEVAHAVVLIGIPPPPQAIHGLLTSTLPAGGAGTMDRYAVDQTGGLTGSPIEEDLDIADADLLNDGEELQVGCPVSGEYDGNILVLNGFKCDFEPA